MLKQLPNKINEFMSNPAFKRYLNLFGLALGIFGVIFILARLISLSSGINLNLTGAQWRNITLTSVLYCGACIIQAFAWHNILKHLNLFVKPSWSIPTFGISQMAKYVPGNIFQFASRQAIGVSEGLPGVPLAKSIAWELGLMAGTAFLFTIFVVPVVNVHLSTMHSLILFFIVLALIILLMTFIVGKRIGLSIGLYAIFFLLTGLVFFFIIDTLSDNQTAINISRLALCGVYIFAWLIGFITPGAPAGVGVREIVLYTLLNPYIPYNTLLITIVIMRFVTVGGDILFYGISWAFKKSKLKV